MTERREGPFEEMGERIGEAAGRIAGRMTDAGADVAARLLGGAVGALGEWWSSDDARAAASTFREREDAARRHHEGSGAGRPFDEVRPLYELGHVAAHDPENAGRSFREVEPRLERAWTEGAASAHGDWDAARPYVGHGFEDRAETLRESREAGMRAQGGGSADRGSIRRAAGDPMM